MLTIVVPTFNRHYYLNQIFSYYANSSFKIIIVDGSDKPLDEAKIKQLPSNIKYFYEKVDLNLRLTKILPLINTPYSCLLGDDELHLSSTLKESIKFLEEHRDYVGCIGLPIGFKNKATNESIFIKSIYPEFTTHTVNQDSPFDRLKYHFTPYTCIAVYSVLRTYTFKAAVISSNIKTSCVYVPEISFELACALLGKLHILQYVSWLRNFDNPAISNKAWDRKFRFQDWFNQIKYKDETELWLNEISKTLHPHTDMGLAILKKYIQNTLSLYASKLPASEIKKQNSTITSIKMYIKKLLNYQRQETNFGGESLIRAKEFLYSTGNISDPKDFDHAFSVIKKFNSSNKTSSLT